MLALSVPFGGQDVVKTIFLQLLDIGFAVHPRIANEDGLLDIELLLEAGDALSHCTAICGITRPYLNGQGHPFLVTHQSDDNLVAVPSFVS
ncbi:MAG: hypothetical protein DDT36_01742 [Firmicutes bacterium]|nr:hypothetical protein [Bacillota bacterium]